MNISKKLKNKICKYLCTTKNSNEPQSIQNSKEKNLGSSNCSFMSLLNEYGVLNSSKDLTDEQKRTISIWFDFKERAEVAMIVAQFYPGGDYFEFGSEGTGTLRNFLTSFDLTDRINAFPDMRFYAFDIFGDMTGATGDHSYFESWNDPNNDRYEAAQRYVKQHGLFEDKVYLVKGFFSKTLTPTFKKNHLSEGRRIGFAFLDCNITNSYREVFHFLEDCLTDKAFIYMDEYFCNPDVPKMFSGFIDQQSLKSYYVRNAGAFGALFQIYR